MMVGTRRERAAFCDMSSLMTDGGERDAGLMRGLMNKCRGLHVMMLCYAQCFTCPNDALHRVDLQVSPMNSPTNDLHNDLSMSVIGLVVVVLNVVIAPT